MNDTCHHAGTANTPPSLETRDGGVSHSILSHYVLLTQGKQGPNDDRYRLGPGKLFHLSKYLLITFLFLFLGT